MLRIEIKVGIEQVRDRLGRFTGYIDRGMQDLRDRLVTRVTEIYRTTLDEVGIKSRTGRLREGIGEKERSVRGFRAVIGPSEDRVKIAEWLESGTTVREMPARAGRVYVMNKLGEGPVLRASIGAHFVRPHNFIDIVQRRVDEMISREFPTMFQVRVRELTE
jgi:hypothetical protein